MRYSEEILNDDNFDEEVEKLAELIGIPHTNYETFVEKLDDNYKKQTHDLGFEEWLKSEIYPSSSGLEANERGFLAYEFGNGFVVFNFDFLI